MGEPQERQQTFVSFDFTHAPPKVWQNLGYLHAELSPIFKSQFIKMHIDDQRAEQVNRLDFLAKLRSFVSWTWTFWKDDEDLNKLSELLKLDLVTIANDFGRIDYYFRLTGHMLDKTGFIDVRRKKEESTELTWDL